MADIELVIKIPKEYYEEIENMPHFKRNYEQDLILEGTPLPEGHGRLIDANSLIKAIEEKAKRLSNADTIYGLCRAVALIFDEPTIIGEDKESEEEE